MRSRRPYSGYCSVVVGRSRRRLSRYFDFRWRFVGPLMVRVLATPPAGAFVRPPAASPTIPPRSCECHPPNDAKDEGGHDEGSEHHMERSYPP
jgi:hypothetical protein